MSRDEHREKCIEAMAIAWLKNRGYKSVVDVPEWMMRQTIEEQTIAFDSLHDIARVNPIEATEEMQHAGSIMIGDQGTWAEARMCYEEMCAIGDLTNAPERKP